MKSTYPRNKLDSLRNNRPRRFRFNADAEAILMGRGLSAGIRRHLVHLPWDTELDEPTLTGLLDQHVRTQGQPNATGFS